MQDPATLLQEGRAEEALAALKEQVRSRPGDVDLRVWLFALHCVLGRWDKADSDLSAIVALDGSWLVPAQVYRGAMAAELVRGNVFAGRVPPLVMGQPDEWLAWNVQALVLEAAGKPAEAWELRRRAFDSAPELPANVNGRACEWLSDTDLRLGPVLEAFVENQYYWIPFSQLKRIELTAPEFLVEIVWMPARLTVNSGGELAAQLPARYPGTESQTDGALSLARRTDRVETIGGGNKLLGQKRFGSPETDFGLLSCRIIEFTLNGEIPPSDANP